MKNLLLILVLLVGVMDYSYGQHYFNKRDPVHSFEGYFRSVIERNGKYYCTGTSVDTINDAGNDTYWYIPGIRFTIFDSSGNKIRDTFYQHPDGRYTNAWENNMHSMPNGDFVLVATSMIDNTNQFDMFSWVMRFDSMGHLIANTEIDKPFCTANEYWSLMDLEPTGTGEWIAVGFINCSNYIEPMLTKFDNNFNVIWHKNISQQNFNANVYKVRVLNGEYLIGAGRSNLGLQSNNFDCRAQLMKTDTSGTQVWSWVSLADSLTSDVQDVIQTQDGGFAYCGLGAGKEINNTSGSEMWWRSWVEKIDAGGNVLWNRVLAPQYINSGYNMQSVIKELSDGSIVIAGTIVSGYDINDSADRNYGSLIKLSDNGDIIWRRLYSAPFGQYQHTINDMTLTADGGFALVGEANNFFFSAIPPYRQAWIIKVDSNGCEQGFGQCNPADVEHIVSGRQTIRVYPNPANDVLHVDGIVETASYKLLSITGAMIQQGILYKGHNTISLSDIPCGVYVLQTGTDVVKVVRE